MPCWLTKKFTNSVKELINLRETANPVTPPRPVPTKAPTLLPIYPPATPPTIANTPVSTAVFVFHTIRIRNSSAVN